MSEIIVDSAIILDPTGLHARPAVKVAKLAKTFDSSVELSASGNGVWVDAKSTNAVMKMKANSGTNLFVRASGDDAVVAVSKIIDLIRSDFKEG